MRTNPHAFTALKHQIVPTSVYQAVTVNRTAHVFDFKFQMIVMRHESLKMQ